MALELANPEEDVKARCGLYASVPLRPCGDTPLNLHYAQLYINSPGGSMYSIMGIIDMMNEARTQF